MKASRHFLVLILTVAVSFSALAGEPTAFQLIKRGNDYVGVQSKDKVVQIRSEKSVASLTPNIWYIVYYDPDATFKAVEVKFGAGEKMDVKRSARVLEMVSKDREVLDREKLKTDSDKALKIATSVPLLKNLDIKASQLWLGHGDQGPQWRVKLWAAKLKNPSDSADIGVVTLSATDGTILKTDLHPNNID